LSQDRGGAGRDGNREIKHGKSNTDGTVNHGRGSASQFVSAGMATSRECTLSPEPALNGAFIHPFAAMTGND
jgi:hypothetical protein